jgi:hypothetical protein
MAAWAFDDIEFEIDPETDDPVVLLTITTPTGVLQVCAEVEEAAGCICLIRAHVQSTIGANGLGAARLRQIADAAMERLECNAIEIEGAVRTTGARQGRLPWKYRFTRRRCALAS